MDRKAIVEAIDEEIAKLSRIRTLLDPAAIPSRSDEPHRRTVSPEGRARIVAAQKARREREKKGQT